MLVIPITHVIDIETQHVVALASTPAKATAIITALNARERGDYYADDPLPVDLIQF
jgi:hypothetical protein